MFSANNFHTGFKRRSDANDQDIDFGSRSSRPRYDDYYSPGWHDTASSRDAEPVVYSVERPSLPSMERFGLGLPSDARMAVLRETSVNTRDSDTSDDSDLAHLRLSSTQSSSAVDTPPIVETSPPSQPVGSENTDKICYGTLFRVCFNLVGEMPKIDAKLRAHGMAKVASHYQLKLAWQSNSLFVQFPDGIPVAVANKQLVEAFEELVRSGTVDFDVLSRIDKLHDVIGASTKASQANALFDLNIYGLSTHREMVGRSLSKAKLWLQQPDWKPPEIRYDNPHVYKIPGIINPPSDTVLQESKPKLESGSKPKLELGTREDVEANVYTRLTRGNMLTGVAGDIGLKTQLLPHQQQGLQFLIQREAGPIPDPYQLWRKETIEGEVWFKHKITATRSRTQPSETGGGILADEMGMGKTLSILALLVRTLTTAEAWSHSNEGHIEDRIPGSKPLSRATLVVVPTPTLLNNWKQEAEEHLNINLKILIHHDIGRPEEPDDIIDHDIVLTTYHTLIADHHRHGSPLNQIGWFRIVLDEAHFIRRSTTLLHKRVAELDAKYRWCLTGTPIQNTLEDIGSLFSFIKAQPFEKIGYFRKYIAYPFNDPETSQSREQGQQRLALLIDSVCVRRTKELLQLKQHYEHIRHVEFTRDESKAYDSIRKQMTQAMTNMSAGSERRSRFGLFQMYLQLRIFCNHGTFQKTLHWASTRHHVDGRRTARGQMEDDGEVMCSACQLPLHAHGSNAKPFEPCQHILCDECSEGGDDNCPLCDASKIEHPQTAARTEHQGSTDSSYGSGKNDYFHSGGYSSKLSALMTDLKAYPAGSKSIVFSCWTTTLDLVEQHFQDQNFTHARIDGNTPVKQREEILRQFKHDPKLSILIMTFGVGAFGLNLTAANRVFLLEPQWNPSVETQAIGRALRIGQDKAVEVIRYIVKDTFELSLQDLQERKRKIADKASKYSSGESSDQPFDQL